jgi:HK97 family phage major capsid protein
MIPHVHQSEILQLDLDDLPKGETPGQAITKNWSFKVLCAKPAGSRAFEATFNFPFHAVKTTYTEATDGIIGAPQIAGPYPAPFQSEYAWQYLDTQPLETSTVKTWRETGSFVQLADAVDENAQIPDNSNWTISQGSVPVRKIAAIVRVSEEILDDMPRFSSFVNDRLINSVLLKLDAEVLSGSGTAPHMTGLLNAGITSISKGALSRASALMTAVSRCRSLGQGTPDLVVLNHADFLSMQTDLASTGGEFSAGPPGVFSDQAQPVYSFGGCRVLQTNALSQGTAIAGCFATGATLFVRKRVSVDSSATDGSNWSFNRLSLRCTMRAALVVTSPLRFTAVTGF